MAFTPQNFKDLSSPAVSANWLNGVDVTVYSVLAGATTPAQALLALGLGGPQTLLNPVAVTQGGTGATTAATGLANLGGVTAAQVNTQISQLYPQTPAETAAGVTATNRFYLPGDVKRYGALADGVTDDTAAVQTAVTYCVSAGAEMFVSGLCKLTSPVNIDRQVDGAPYDNYFHIIGQNGGGFIVSTAIPMFSSSIAFSTAPVTQLVSFEGISFRSTNAVLAAYVLDDAKYLRTKFIGCDFDFIKCLNAPIVYTQSIYFNHCNMRRWQGVFFNSVGAASFDIKAMGCLMEGVPIGSGFVMNLPVGCRFIAHTCEGLTTGTAISANGSQSLFINGYFERNQRDIDLTAGSHLGVVIAGGQFNTTTGGGQNIYWGIAENAVSIGNYSSGSLHNLTPASKVRICDYAPVAVTNRPGQAEIPWNIPVGDAYASAVQPVISNTFTQCVLDAPVIDTNSGFAGGTYTVTIPGYYRVKGKINVISTGGTITRVIASIYKNGAETQRLLDQQVTVSPGASYIIGGEAELLLGIGDTVQLWGFITSAGAPAFGFNSVQEACRLSIAFTRSVGV